MANSLYPAAVKVEHTSAYSIHLLTLPTRAYTPPGGLFTDGSFLDWDDDDLDAFAMVNDLFTLIAELYPATSHFGIATIYTYDTPTSPGVPVHTMDLDIDGTLVSTAWAAAVQQTWTFRTTEAGIAKLTFLDIPTDNDFSRVAVLPPASDQLAVAQEFMSTDAGWSGRDNARPSVFLQASTTLNEALRRSYRLD
jgi:hypothetical protein